MKVSDLRGGQNLTEIFCPPLCAVQDVPNCTCVGGQFAPPICAATLGSELCAINNAILIVFRGTLRLNLPDFRAPRRQDNYSDLATLRLKCILICSDSEIEYPLCYVLSANLSAPILRTHTPLCYFLPECMPVCPDYENAYHYRCILRPTCLCRR